MYRVLKKLVHRRVSVFRNCVDKGSAIKCYDAVPIDGFCMKESKSQFYQ